MSTQTDWTFDGQLDNPQESPTSPEQEREKIAALFGKTQEEPLHSDEEMDYQAAFEQHKKGQPSTSISSSQNKENNSPEDISAKYKAHLSQLLRVHEDEIVHYRVELERLEELIVDKEKMIKTIQAITSAMDTLE